MKDVTCAAVNAVFYLFFDNSTNKGTRSNKLFK